MGSTLVAGARLAKVSATGSGTLADMAAASLGATSAAGITSVTGGG